MSLYNLINGVNPAAFFILPMLGYHPNEYPRFRDCFAEPELNEIHVLTRTGGGNRESYEAENNWLETFPTYISNSDDDFDDTFALWKFKVPEKWIPDYILICDGKADEVSKEYANEVLRVWPKLKDKLTLFFKNL